METRQSIVAAVRSERCQPHRAGGHNGTCARRSCRGAGRAVEQVCRSRRRSDIRSRSGGGGEAASNGGGGSSSNTAMIAGIAGGVAGVVVVAACVIIAVIIKKRRRRGEEGSEEGRSSETSMTADFL